MGDRIGVQHPVWENLSRYVNSHPGQLSLAIPPWVDANEYHSIVSDALQLGSKAGVARVWWQVKLHDPRKRRIISEIHAYCNNMAEMQEIACHSGTVPTVSGQAVTLHSVKHESVDYYTLPSSQSLTEQQLVLHFVDINNKCEEDVTPLFRHVCNPFIVVS